MGLYVLYRVEAAAHDDPIRLFVCDDSLGYAALIQSWCEAVSGVVPAGTASTAKELLQALPDARPDVLLLDYLLPDGPTDADLVGRIRQLVPGIRVVLISGMAREDLTEHADAAGADAYCSKMIDVDGLLNVITGYE